MWRLGSFFHEMSFDLLSVFLSLCVIAIGGSLVDIGTMSATALFLAISASFFWGYICDKTRLYKRYILNSSGGVIGHFLAYRRSNQSREKSHIVRITVVRGTLAFLFLVVT